MAFQSILDEYQRIGARGKVNEAAINAYMQRVVNRLPGIDAIRITDSQGLLRYGSDVDSGVNVNLSDRPHFIYLKDHPQNRFAISGIQKSRVNNKLVIVLAMRITKPDGEFGGMIFAPMPLGWFAETLSTVNAGAHGIVNLRDDELKMILRFPEPNGGGIGSSAGMGTITPPLQEALDEDRMAGTYSVHSVLDQMERIYSYRRLGTVPLYVTVGFAAEDYLTDWYQTRTKILILAFAFFCITSISAYIIYRGKKHQQHAIQALTDQEAKFRTVADFTYGWEYWQGNSGEILYMSPSCESITGYRADEFIADPNLLIQVIHPDDRELVTNQMKNVSSDVGLRIDFRIIRRDGLVRWINCLCRLVTDNQGNALGQRVSNRDDTERKRFEQDLEQSRATYQGIFNSLNEAVYIQDQEGHFLEVNDGVLMMYGQPKEYFIGATPEKLAAPGKNNFDELRMQLSKAYNGIPQSFEFWAVRANGDIFPKEVHLYPGTYFDRHVVVAVAVDISERKTMEEELQLAAEVYQNSAEAIIVTDARNCILAVNPAFTITTGYETVEVLGKNPAILRSGKQDDKFYREMWQSLNASGHWHGEIWNRRKNGDVYPEWLSINTIYKNNTVHRRIALFSDISERKHSEEMLWHETNFDGLTGLPNRRMFSDRLAHEIRKAHRDEAGLALLFIDIDRFKEINDTLGHEAGDTLLVAAARRIRECVREIDTVARMGGDEFAIIVSEAPETGAVDRIAQNVVESLSRPFSLGTEQVYVSASVGITLYPDDGAEVDILLKNADQAMYLAKGEGRNRFSYFTPTLQEAAHRRLRMTNDLRQAIHGDQLRVYYQPIIDLNSGAINKAEALVRWKIPGNGLISPAEFIPLAEETGLIVDIGAWVFKEAAHQVRRIRKLYNPNFQISVNKSPIQFRKSIENQLFWPDYLQEQGVSGDAIVIEITEGLLLNAEDSVRQRLVNYGKSGMQVALDDFGTGYSSLAYLKQFDIDYLKIDQIFVRNLENEPNSRALCESIIVMAHKLGLKVIAEGVETEYQKEFLKQAECDFGQGYYFSRPVPAEEFELLVLQEMDTR